MPIKVFHDPFDTELLERKCAKILISAIGPTETIDAVRRAVDQVLDAEMVYLSMPHDVAIMAEVHRMGFVMITTRNIYACPAAKEPECVTGLPVLRLLRQPELSACFTIADVHPLIEQLVMNSRYWKDERIPRAYSLALYERWFENSIYGDFANEVIAVEDDSGAIVGLVSLRKREGAAFIDLIVVDERARGKGIGHALVEATHAYARAESLDMLRVETEGENVKANRFYQRRGFLLESHSLAFHRHSYSHS